MASSSSSTAFGSFSTNYARIGHVAQQLFPEIFQELITIKEPPKKLLFDVNRNSYLPNNLGTKEQLLIKGVVTKGYADFDIPLIYKLVRNLKLLPPPTQGWNYSIKPCLTEITPGDDLERVRRFRNEILHRGNAQVSNTDLSQFFTQFKAIAGRIETYLGKQTGEFVDKFIHLETCCIDEETRNVYIKKLEDLKKSDADIRKNLQIMETKIKEMERKQDGEIPKNVFEQFEKRLQIWKETDKIFVSTEAKKQVMEHLLSKSCITIIGNSGTGKTILSRHVALKMIDQGYTIVPCEYPRDIRQFFKHGKKTIFVFDDVCGRYTLNQQVYNEWNQILDHITCLLKDNNCKILSTCRLQVFKDENFSSLSIFKICNIDLSSKEFRLTAPEKLALTKVYSFETADNVKQLSETCDFFPLLCSLYHKQKLQKHVSIGSFLGNPFNVFIDEMDKLYIENDDGKLKYCSLALCVMCNNTLTDEILSSKNKENVSLIEELLVECELNKTTSVKRLMKSLKTLDGSYVVRDGSTHKIIHDKLFDILARYFGEKMLQLFISHAKSSFIRERFLWKTKYADKEFAIKIPDDKINRYIDRMLKDWEDGYVDNVFMNRNMKHPTFTEKFINYISRHENTKLEKLVCTPDVNTKDSALVSSCFVGSIDLVRWLIRLKSSINYCEDDSSFPLFGACQEGHVHVVKELIQHFADVNKCKRDGKSSLWIASQNGRLNVVKELLLHSAAVHIYEKNDVSPLWTASQNGHADVVQELLEHSARVNASNWTGVSPLLIASENGHNDVVTKLLQYLADVNQCMYDGVSPLWMSSQNGHVNVVKELIHHGAQVNKCDYRDVSVLWKASQNGHVDVVKELLQHAAAVDIYDNENVSPLWTASQNGHVDIVQELIKHAARVNDCNDKGVSPLLIASENGHVAAVIKLLQFSADVNKCMYDGVSPLWMASQHGHVNVVKELIQHRAKVNKCDYRNISSLWKASQNGHVDIVTELLQHAAAVDIYDNNNASPLWIASFNGHVDVVQKLIEHSARVNDCNSNGVSPLLIASENGHNDVVTKLLQNSADVNKCMNDGVSPLWMASQNGHVNVVKELLQHLADINKNKHNGISPLSIATQQGHFDVVEVLQHHLDIV